MPGILHEKMVNASMCATAAVLSVGAEIRKLTHKRQPRRIPDLFSTNEIAIETLNFSNGGRLDKYGYTYKSLVVVIPIPDNVTDIWLYDESADSIVERFHRSIDKIRTPRVQLECFRCDYKWTPRIAKAPKMCPRCKSREWNTRPSSSHAEKRDKRERIRKLVEASSR